MKINRVGRSVFPFYHFLRHYLELCSPSCRGMCCPWAEFIRIFNDWITPLGYWLEENGGEVFILLHKLKVSLKQLSCSRLWTLGCIRQLIKFIGNPYFAFETSSIKFYFMTEMRCLRVCAQIRVGWVTVNRHIFFF